LQDVQIYEEKPMYGGVVLNFTGFNSENLQRTEDP